MSLFSQVISWFGVTGTEVVSEAAEEAAEGASITETAGAAGDVVVSEARDFLTRLVTEIESPVYARAGMSPLDFVDHGIDFSGGELDILKDTAASFYQLMIVLSAGGMVLSIMIGAVSIGLHGERAKHEVLSSLFSKTAIVIVLLGFVGVFGMFGAIANQLTEVFTAF